MAENGPVGYVRRDRCTIALLLLIIEHCNRLLGEEVTNKPLVLRVRQQLYYLVSLLSLMMVLAVRLILTCFPQLNLPRSVALATASMYRSGETPYSL